MMSDRCVAKNLKRAWIVIAFFFGVLAVSLVSGQENVVIVLDDSGSMNERMGSGVTRIEAAKNAISEVLKRFPPDSKLGLFLLNGSMGQQHWAIPLGALSVPQSLQKIKSLRANGGTPLGDRMREGADALLKLREQQVYGVYRLLIVTDGEANDAKQLAAYLPDVLSRGIIVDVIGVDLKQNHSLATRVHSYRKADDAEALSKAVQEVFAERVDASGTGSGDDYKLLEAIDSETAKEALKVLSKPNNGPIVGVKQPEAWKKESDPQAGSSAGGVSILTVLVTAMLSCTIPLLFVVLVIAFAFSKAKKG